MAKDLTLDQILAISEKPGLYKLITQTRGGLLAESLTDGKRIAVNLRNNVSLISEIAIYTLEEEVPLREVFKKIKEKESGEPTSVKHNSGKDELEEYFFSVLPNFDEDRVYQSDIKKVIKWYNILQQQDLLNVLDQEEPEKN